MSEANKFWPYILLMPSTYDERVAFIKDVLASRIASTVLPKFEESSVVLQRDLIRDLTHSNKSIIRYLEILRSYGLIETGSKVEGGKRVVYHEPTKRGWGVIRFFSEGLPSDVRELTESLLEEYLTSLSSFYREHNLEESVFFEILTRVRAKTIAEGSTRYSDPDFMIFGASAIFTQIQCDQFSKTGAEISCRKPNRFAGGPSLELASTLANQDSKVVFVSSIGDDLNGWNVLASLITKGIDVGHFVVEVEKQTNETILIDDGKIIRKLVGIDEGFSLSLTSPSQIPWDIMKKSSVVYIGEVFIEVALAIATFCTANRIPSIFRCSEHYWRLGLAKIAPLLKQVDMLLVSPAEWKIAKNELGANPIIALRKYTNADVLIKIDETRFNILNRDTTTLKGIEARKPEPDLEPSFVSELILLYKDNRALEVSLNECVASR